MTKIERFDGEFKFLSNFYESPIEYKGIKYRNSEAAYQAMKCENEDDYILFTNLNGYEAKKKGRQIKMRKDWDTIKLDVMRDILIAKYTQNKDVCKMLIDTGDVEIIEGNYWHDTFWGVCNGVGRNELGKILMDIREALK